jgi:hypothetical protein
MKTHQAASIGRTYDMTEQQNEVVNLQLTLSWKLIPAGLTIIQSEP